MIKNFIGSILTLGGGCYGVYLVPQLNNFIFKILFGIVTIFLFLSFAFHISDLIFGEKTE